MAPKLERLSGARAFVTADTRLTAVRDIEVLLLPHANRPCRAGPRAGKVP
jgi:hypothetical protein